MARLSLVAQPKTAPTVTTTATVSPRLRRLTTTRIEKRTLLDTLTAEIKELDEQLLKETKRQGGKIETEDWMLTAVPSKSVHIMKETLLALGVKASIIKKATKETPYEYVKVTVRKGKGEKA